MVEDALDELYSARPEDFTALRTELAAKAKSSGDAYDGAKQAGREAAAAVKAAKLRLTTTD